MDENCPCLAVRELKETVARHDRQLNRDHTEFAEIRKDLQYIKESLDKKSRLNVTTVTCIMQAVCTLVAAAVAAKMGFS